MPPNADPLGSGNVPLHRALAALLCLIFVGLAALQGGLLTLGLPARFIRLGTRVLVLVFAARAVGEFRYVGFFKRVRGTSFARRDSLFYSPLCALISALAAGLAVLAP